MEKVALLFFNKLHGIVRFISRTQPQRFYGSHYKDYNQKSFKVSETFFADNDVEEDDEGNEKKIEGFVKSKKIVLDKNGLGKEIAIIYMDEFGNELFKQFTI